LRGRCGSAKSDEKKTTPWKKMLEDLGKADTMLAFLVGAVLMFLFSGKGRQSLLFSSTFVIVFLSLKRLLIEDRGARRGLSAPPRGVRACPETPKEQQYKSESR
jgi:hypothetical protein